MMSQVNTVHRRPAFCLGFCCVLIQGSPAWIAYKASTILPTFWFSRTWWQEVLTISFPTCTPVMSISTTAFLPQCALHFDDLRWQANLCILYELKFQTFGIGEDSHPELAVYQDTCSQKYKTTVITPHEKLARVGSPHCQVWWRSQWSVQWL